MPVQNKRFMITVPRDIEVDVADVKKNLFCDKTYSEIYRYLIRRGLDALKTESPHKPSKTV